VIAPFTSSVVKMDATGLKQRVVYPPPVHVHAADIIGLLVAGEATHGLVSDTAGRMIGSVGLPPLTQAAR
jgi:hypothetical protein